MCVSLMFIVEGTAENGIAVSISKLIGSRLVKIEYKIFSDGESYIRVPEDGEGEAVVVQSTHYPQEKRLMELVFIADALRGIGIERITAVIPYLSYLRQNDRFGRGDALSASSVLKVIKSAGIGRIIVVEPHKLDVLSYFEGDVAVVDVSEMIAAKIKGEFMPEIILSPDEGGIEQARKMSKIFGCKYTYLEKARDRDSGAISIKGIGNYDFSGKKVMIVDDMISSGSTIIEAAKFAFEGGANIVVAYATHLLLADNAYKKIKEAGVSEVYGTNTIPSKDCNVIDISAEIAAKL